VDAEHTFPLFCPAPLGEVKQIAPGLSYKTYDTGHILGSTSMVLEADGVRLGYSGDVGRPGLPIIRDPQPLGPCDYLILESTYGSRIHAQLGQVAGTLTAIINRTAGRGGKIIVPAFAVGRTTTGPDLARVDERPPHSFDSGVCR
jgi:metallo-beta-lactamase family protein